MEPPVLQPPAPRRLRMRGKTSNTKEGRTARACAAKASQKKEELVPPKAHAEVLSCCMYCHAKDGRFEILACSPKSKRMYIGTLRGASKELMDNIKQTFSDCILNKATAALLKEEFGKFRQRHYFEKDHGQLMGHCGSKQKKNRSSPGPVR